MKISDFKKYLLIVPFIIGIVLLTAFFVCLSRSKSNDKSSLRKDSPCLKAEKTAKKEFEPETLSKLSDNDRALLEFFCAENNMNLPEKVNNKNTVTVLYKKKNTGLAEKKLSSFNENNSFTCLSSSVLNTKEMGADELLSALSELSASFSGGEKVLSKDSFRLCLYLCLHGDKADTITIKDFLKLPQNSNNLPDFTKIDLKLDNTGLADFFSIENAQASVLFMAYEKYATDHPRFKDGDPQISMTLPELSDFLKSKVIYNEDFSEYLSENLVKDILLFCSFADKDMLEKELSVSEIAALLGVSEDTIKSVLVLKGGFFSTGSDLPSFVDYLINNVAESPLLGSYIDEHTYNELIFLQELISLTLSGKRLDYKESSDFFGLDLELMRKLYLYKELLDGTGSVSDEGFTPHEIIEFLLNPEIDDTYMHLVPSELKTRIINCSRLITAYESDGQYTAEEIYDMLSAYSSNLSLNTINTLMLENESGSFVPDKLSFDEASEILSKDISSFKNIDTSFIDTSVTGFLNTVFSSYRSLTSFFSSENYERCIIISDSDNFPEEKAALLAGLPVSKFEVYGDEITHIELKQKYKPLMLAFCMLSALSFIFGAALLLSEIKNRSSAQNKA